MSDSLLGLVICFLYICSVIGLGEGLRRWRGYSPAFTRKVIHIGVGMVMWILPWIFRNPWPFVATSILFMGINFLDWRYGFIPAMESADRSNVGTILFPLSTALAAVFLWDRPPLMVAALMPLTWGDGLASVVGNRLGTRKYRVFNHHRTVEGSITFFIATFLWTSLALWGVPGTPELSLYRTIFPSIGIALATTLGEAVSYPGLDNLIITLTAVTILLLWPL